MVVGDEESAAVFAVVLVVANSDIETQVLVEVDLVIHEDRVGHEVRALRVLEDRRPANESAVARRLEDGENVVPADVGASAEDAEVAPRLVVVGEAKILEVLIAEPNVMASGGSSRQEIGALRVEGLVVAPFGSQVGKRRAVVARVAPGSVEDEGALNQVVERAAASLERELLLGVLGLDEDLVRQDAVVGGRKKSIG